MKGTTFLNITQTLPQEYINKIKNLFVKEEENWIKI